MTKEEEQNITDYERWYVKNREEMEKAEKRLKDLDEARSAEKLWHKLEAQDD